MTNDTAQTKAAPPVSRSQSATSAASAQVVGNFHLGDCLGRGAFGSVYRGLNWTTGETVAVKQVRLGKIPSGELREIMAEIDLLRNLKHPNIVKYKGSEKTREYLFIILEYCENGSLQHICKRFGKFPEGLVAVYISQVLDGLSYLHEQGVIHRDIKGANILTNKDGSVKLADFGVATKTGSLLDDNNAVVGSPYWMAPEVIDQSGATTASDVWSVGCVVIELLEGKPPYHYLDPMPALFRIVQDDCPPIPEGASSVVKDFLMHCFQKDVNLRISAKKLSRHPWIVAARRQLEQMRNGGSLRGHADAVKSVKEWNEAIKEPAKPIGAVHHHRDVKAPAHHPHRPKKETLVDQSIAEVRTVVGHFDFDVATQRPAEKIRSAGDRVPMPATLVGDNVHYASQQSVTKSTSDTDNWDEDFEDGIPFNKLAALEHSPRIDMGDGADGGAKTEAGRDDLDEEEDDNFPTIKPTPAKAITAPQDSTSARPASSPSTKVIDDYSDLMFGGGASAFDRGTAQLQQKHRAGGLDSIASTPLLPPGNSQRHDSVHLPSVALSPTSPVPEPVRTLDQYAEDEEEEDFSDLGVEMAFNSTEPPLKLVSRHSSESWSAEEEDVEDDPFREFDEEGTMASGDLKANIARDKYARMCSHTVSLFHRLSIDTPEDDLIETCDELELILTEQADMKAQALAAHGALTVLELLESVQIRDVVCRLLGLLNVIIFEDVQAQENLCLIGAIPVVMPFCSKKYPHHVRIEAAYFVYSMCSTSTLTLQFVLSCRGLKTLVQLVDEDYTQQRDLVWLGVACVNAVLEMQSPASRNAFCRMLAKEGLLEPLSTALLCVLQDDGPSTGKERRQEDSRDVDCGSADEDDDDDADQATSARHHILRTFVIYSASETQLKQQVAQRRVLRRLLQACRKLDRSSLTQMLKVFKNLTMSPSLLDEIENCNTIEVLVRILAERHDGACGTEISNQILNAMYNLCRLNVRRQEEAAQAGIIPQLLRIASTSSPLKQFALPILCDMAHASKATRKVLAQQCGVSFFLDLLQDANWQLPALESVCVWLQGDLARIEEHLLRPHAVQALLFVFASSKPASLETLLETFLKLFRLSASVALVMGRQPRFLKRLADRLQSSSAAIVRLSLLRMCKAITDVHTDVKALLAQFGLLDIIRRLAHEDGAVLVRELAREIAVQAQVPHKVSSFNAKDANRTVRQVASESDVGAASPKPRTSSHLLPGSHRAQRLSGSSGSTTPASNASRAPLLEALITRKASRGRKGVPTFATSHSPQSPPVPLRVHNTDIRQLRRAARVGGGFDTPSPMHDHET